MHLGQGDDESELIILHVELEQGPSPHNLQAWQHDLPHVNMRDQHVAGHLPATSTDEFSKVGKSRKTLPDVLKEAEIKVLVLEPGELQVSVHIGAVRVSVPANICVKNGGEKQGFYKMRGRIKYEMCPIAVKGWRGIYWYNSVLFKTTRYYL